MAKLFNLTWVFMLLAILAVAGARPYCLRCSA